MTQYDAFALFREQEQKDKATCLHLNKTNNHSMIEQRFTDGTRTVWEKKWFGWKKTQERKRYRDEYNQ